MQTLQISFYAIAISFCLFFALLSRRLLIRLSLSYFILYLLLKALSFSFAWLEFHPSAPIKGMWFAGLMCLSFLFAPCLWLFSLEASSNSAPSLKLIKPKQRILIGVGMLLTLPLINSTQDYFIFNYQALAIKAYEGLIVHGSMLICIALFLLQAAFYIYKSVDVLRQNTQKNKVMFSNLDDMPLNVLRGLIYMMMANWIVSLAKTLRVFFGLEMKGFDLFFTLAEVLIILWVFYHVIKSVLNHSDADSTLIDSLNLSAVNNALPMIDSVTGDDSSKHQQVKKYVNSALDEAIALRIKNKVTKAMTEDKLYQNSSLKLQSLSQHINENSHYVSQVINQGLNSSFYELINSHRILAAQSLLEQEQPPSMLDIALDVGYNSKSTFNSAFKRINKLTPSQYRINFINQGL